MKRLRGSEWEEAQSAGLLRSARTRQIQEPRFVLAMRDVLPGLDGKVRGQRAARRPSPKRPHPPAAAVVACANPRKTTAAARPSLEKTRNFRAAAVVACANPRKTTAAARVACANPRKTTAAARVACAKSRKTTAAARPSANEKAVWQAGSRSHPERAIFEDCYRRSPSTIHDGWEKGLYSRSRRAIFAILCRLASIRSVRGGPSLGITRRPWVRSASMATRRAARSVWPSR